MVTCHLPNTVQHTVEQSVSETANNSTRQYSIFRFYYLQTEGIAIILYRQFIYSYTYMTVFSPGVTIIIIRYSDVALQ